MLTNLFKVKNMIKGVSDFFCTILQTQNALVFPLKMIQMQVYVNRPTL